VKTVLIVDDEAAIIRLVRDYLERAGFEVMTATTGAAALREFTRRRPDLVILDLTLPETDGLDVARAIRRAGDVPIIMLTARTEEADRVAGLELGADDYVTKPFSARELVARVRAVMRRAQIAATRDDVVRVGESLVLVTDLCLDEYTDHGHCGLLTADGDVDNDATLERYAAAAVAQARRKIGDANAVAVPVEQVGDQYRRIRDVMLGRPGEMLDFDVECAARSIVAQLAEQQLSPAAHAQVQRLLAEEEFRAYVLPELEAHQARLHLQLVAGPEQPLRRGARAGA